MERWIGKAAIVTGASEGIGFAITEELLNAGVNVVGCGRNQAKLDNLKTNLHGRKGKIYTLRADICKEEEVVNLFKYVKENVGPLHILVNNAGYFGEANLTEGKTEVWKQTLDTNVLGLCIATREAVQSMRANKIDGHIIHLNSVPVYSLPTVNVYTASKRAVSALTETLRNELNLFGDKIKVTSISPGYVKTKDEEEFESYPYLKPCDVANVAMYVLSTPPHVQIHELTVRPLGETIT